MTDEGKEFVAYPEDDTNHIILIPSQHPHIVHLSPQFYLLRKDTMHAHPNINIPFGSPVHDKRNAMKDFIPGDRPALIRQAPTKYRNWHLFHGACLGGERSKIAILREVVKFMITRGNTGETLPLA